MDNARLQYSRALKKTALSWSALSWLKKDVGSIMGAEVLFDWATSCWYIATSRSFVMSEGFRWNCEEKSMTKAVRTEMNSATYGELNKCIISLRWIWSLTKTRITSMILFHSSIMSLSNKLVSSMYVFHRGSSFSIWSLKISSHSGDISFSSFGKAIEVWGAREDGIEMVEVNYAGGKLGRWNHAWSFLISRETKGRQWQTQHCLDSAHLHESTKNSSTFQWVTSNHCSWPAVVMEIWMK